MSNIDKLSNTELARIFRKEAAYQCDIARAWYDQGGMLTGDAAMNNASALMRMAADHERRSQKETPHHD